MTKRFIESELFDNANFVESNVKIKLLTIFLFTKCDCIGIFRIALPLVQVYIGEPITEKDILSTPLKVEKIKDGVFWLIDFCKFQYGELTEACRPHQKYIKLLKEYGLYQRVCKGYAKGTHTHEEKEKEKEEEKEEEEGNSMEYELSGLLLNLILERKPDFKKPNLQNWSKVFDLMIRIDKRTPEKIRAVIQWSQQDAFWQNNILSAEKLRKQFDKLELQMVCKPKSGGTGTAGLSARELVAAESGGNDE